MTEAGKMIRVRNIVADSFEWVYSAFACTPELEKVDPKMLRSILRRTYELVRCDIPNRPLEVDYEILEQAATMSGFLPSLYGISTLDDPAKFNASFPYTLTQIAKKIGVHVLVACKCLAGEDQGRDGRGHQSERELLPHGRQVRQGEREPLPQVFGQVGITAA